MDGSDGILSGACLRFGSTCGPSEDASTRVKGSFSREKRRERNDVIYGPLPPSPISLSLCLPVVAGIRSLFCPSHLIDQSRSFVLMLDFFKLSNCHAMFYDVESTLQASRTTTILPGTILR